MNAEIVLKQMIVIFLLIMVGYILQKKKMVTQRDGACLSKLIVEVFNPAIIVSSVIGNTGSSKGNIAQAAFLAAILFIMLIFLAVPVSRIFAKKRMEQRVYSLIFVFSNLGFIGIPVVQSIFGKGALIYVAIFILEYNILLYTYGYLLVMPPDSKFHPESLKSLLNMGTLSCLLALLIFVCHIRLPYILGTTITYLGNVATPLALIVIGISIGQQEHLYRIFCQWKLYLFLIVKMILVPLVIAAVLKRLPISEELARVSVILMAMPVGSMTVLLLKENNLEETLCSDSIILSSLLSIVSIPFLVFCYRFF